MKASWNGSVIAESDDVVVVEGNHYFPLDALDRQYVSDSEKTTVCGWKGTASYLHITVDGETNSDAAWYYPDPKPAAAEVLNRVAFWHGVEVEH